MFEKILTPDFYVSSVYNIDYEELKDRGIELLIFDIDNTLKSYDECIPSSDNLNLFKKLDKMGFKICLLSNGRKSRVIKYNENIKLRAIHMGLKPFAINIKKLMKEFNVGSACMIGDQIFTDVIAGKRAKIMTALVVPIKPKKTRVEKIKRKIEQNILAKYGKKIK